MERKRLSRILAKSSVETLKSIAEPVMKEMPITVLRKPAKTMVMVRMKETVAKADYYIGELLACEAMVEISGTKGFALLAGDDMDKVLYAAVIDAALKLGNPYKEDITKILLHQENQINVKMQEEIRLHQATQVKFETLDTDY